MTTSEAKLSYFDMKKNVPKGIICSDNLNSVKNL